MCGVNSATVMLMCTTKMGAKEAELVRYMTSGEVSGDMDYVVGIRRDNCEVSWEINIYKI